MNGLRREALRTSDDRKGSTVKEEGVVAQKDLADSLVVFERSLVSAEPDLDRNDDRNVHLQTRARQWPR